MESAACPPAALRAPPSCNSRQWNLGIIRRRKVFVNAAMAARPAGLMRSSLPMAASTSVHCDTRRRRHHNRSWIAQWSRRGARARPSPKPLQASLDDGQQPRQQRQRQPTPPLTTTEMDPELEPPPPYADWWTRADAAAAQRVGSEREADDDEYVLREAMRSLPTASPWWEVLELTATFGAAGGGLAALLMQEATVAVLVAALPLVAAGARAQRDRVYRRLTATLLMEMREESAGLARKIQRDAGRSSAVNAAVVAAATAAADAAATSAVVAVVPQVSAAIDERALAAERFLMSAMEKGVGGVEARIRQLEIAVAESAASARASAREAGSVAGMLARDVAAARVDTRDGLQTLSRELRAAAETAQSAAVGAKGDVLEELSVLLRLVRSVEREAEDTRASLTGVGLELEALPG